MHAIGTDHDIMGLRSVIIEADLNMLPGRPHAGDRRVPADRSRRHTSPQKVEQITTAHAARRDRVPSEGGLVDREK
jgi:hypothetical protein